jgi:hypothetical protein
LARAKDTSRAEARRRTRETVRAEQMAAESDAEALIAEDVGAEAGPAERTPLFKMPNFREDLRALPRMFMTRRLLWLPLALLLVGAGLVLMLPSLTADIGALAQLYIQFFFIPPALFTFFVAGFVAPRASYMVGFLYGILGGVLWTIAFIPTSALRDLSIFGGQLGLLVMNGIIYGTFAAAFAAWYRDFLRRMQDRGRSRRAEQEAKLKAQRRDERQEARRVARQKPST